MDCLSYFLLLPFCRRTQPNMESAGGHVAPPNNGDVNLLDVLHVIPLDTLRSCFGRATVWESDVISRRDLLQCLRQASRSALNLRDSLVTKCAIDLDHSSGYDRLWQESYAEYAAFLERLPCIKELNVTHTERNDSGTLMGCLALCGSVAGGRVMTLVLDVGALPAGIGHLIELSFPRLEKLCLSDSDFLQ